jgi:5-dehydro-2-deoxygluconokinase
MAAHPPARFDLITMGRSSIDLYSNDVGSPFVEITNFAAYVGGSPTNIAVGAQRLNVKTALLTAVGNDPVGDFILNFLNHEGIETRYIPRKPNARSSAVVLGIEPPDRFPLVFYRDNAADIQLTIDDVIATPIEHCRAFEFAGTNLSKEPSRSATFFAVGQAKKGSATVFFDIDFRADQWHDVRAFGVNARAVLRNADVALGTEEEILAAMLTDPTRLKIKHSQISAPEITGDLGEAIQTILALGPSTLVVKRGAKGATIFQKGQPAMDVPGFPVEIYNILGAGDAFASGLICGYLKGWDWYKSARLGNACGAIVVTRHGCANFMAYEDEVLRFIEERGGF